MKKIKNDQLSLTLFMLFLVFTFILLAIVITHIFVPIKTFNSDLAAVLYSDALVLVLLLLKIL